MVAIYRLKVAVVDAVAMDVVVSSKVVESH
jgi:hypothetical protein